MRSLICLILIILFYFGKSSVTMHKYSDEVSFIGYYGSEELTQCKHSKKYLNDGLIIEGSISVPTTGNYEFALDHFPRGEWYFRDMNNPVDGVEYKSAGWCLPSSNQNSPISSSVLALNTHTYYPFKIYIRSGCSIYAASFNLKWKKPGDSVFSEIPAGNLFLSTNEECETGYYGPDCQGYCDTCGTNQECDDGLSGVGCTCMYGFIGENCTEEDTNPLVNGSVLVNHYNGEELFNDPVALNVSYTTVDISDKYLYDSFEINGAIYIPEGKNGTYEVRLQYYPRGEFEFSYNDINGFELVDGATLGTSGWCLPTETYSIPTGQINLDAHTLNPFRIRMRTGCSLYTAFARLEFKGPDFPTWTTVPATYLRPELLQTSDCEVNYYGSDCSSKCNCTLEHTICDSGKGGQGCICESGWTGENCSFDVTKFGSSIPSGVWLTEYSDEFFTSEVSKTKVSPMSLSGTYLYKSFKAEGAIKVDNPGAYHIKYDFFPRGELHFDGKLIGDEIGTGGWCLPSSDQDPIETGPYQFNNNTYYYIQLKMRTGCNIYSQHMHLLWKTPADPNNWVLIPESNLVAMNYPSKPAECSTGFFGEDCQGACDCINGICSAGIQGDGACRCPTGYIGELCDTLCDKESMCSGHGDCLQYGCLCDPGWRGEKCETCYGQFYHPVSTGVLVFYGVVFFITLIYLFNQITGKNRNLNIFFPWFIPSIAVVFLVRITFLVLSLNVLDSMDNILLAFFSWVPFSIFVGGLCVAINYYTTIALKKPIGYEDNEIIFSTSPGNESAPPPFTSTDPSINPNKPPVGLKNLGSTCYLNSFLQILYHIGSLKNSIKKAVGSPNDNNGIFPTLKKLFTTLDAKKSPGNPSSLAASFGWNSEDLKHQHDVHEFSKILCDKLEEKMKGSQVETIIPDIFKGQSQHFVQCTNIQHGSSQIESFSDVSLQVSNCTTLIDSIRQFLAVQKLQGPNQYSTPYGPQDAVAGVNFKSMPHILQIHLKRFSFNPTINEHVKINDKLEYGEYLDLTGLDTDNASSNIYKLFGVISHQGTTINNGHYISYVQPYPKEQWYCFDDERVFPVGIDEVYTNNYGVDPYAPTDENLKTAYMLFYVKEGSKDEILKVLYHRGRNFKKCRLFGRGYETETTPLFPQETNTFGQMTIPDNLNRRDYLQEIKVVAQRQKSRTYSSTVTSFLFIMLNIIIILAFILRSNSDYSQLQNNGLALTTGSIVILGVALLFLSQIKGTILKIQAPTSVEETPVQQFHTGVQFLFSITILQIMSLFGMFECYDCLLDWYPPWLAVAFSAGVDSVWAIAIIYLRKTSCPQDELEFSEYSKDDNEDIELDDLNEDEKNARIVKMLKKKKGKKKYLGCCPPTRKCCLIFCVIYMILSGGMLGYFWPAWPTWQINDVVFAELDLFSDDPTVKMDGNISIVNDGRYAITVKNAVINLIHSDQVIGAAIIQDQDIGAESISHIQMSIHLGIAEILPVAVPLLNELLFNEGVLNFIAKGYADALAMGLLSVTMNLECPQLVKSDQFPPTILGGVEDSNLNLKVSDGGLDLTSKTCDPCINASNFWFMTIEGLYGQLAEIKTP